MATICKDLMEVNALQLELEVVIAGKSLLGAYHAAKRWVSSKENTDSAVDAILLAWLALRQKDRMGGGVPKQQRKQERKG